VGDFKQNLLEMLWAIAIVAVVIFLMRMLRKGAPSREEKPKTEWDEIKFFVDLNQELPRDYTLIIDRSGSMSSSSGWFSPSRWSEAEQAVAQLAPYVTRVDPDGIT
jgi:hypothetical protein